MKYLIILMLYCVGCATAETIEPIEIDPELQPYVNSFQSTFSLIINYSVIFVDDLKNNWVGECVVYENGDKQINIKKSYFESATNAQKEQLLYHEFGHCSLGWQHVEGTIVFPNSTTKWPISIMRASAFNTVEANMYMNEHNYYINQLRGK